MYKFIINLFNAFLALNHFGSLARSQSIPRSICLSLNGSIECGEFESKLFFPLFGDLQKNNLTNIRSTDQHKMIQNNMEIQQIAIQKMLDAQLDTIKKLIPQDIRQCLDKIKAAQTEIQFEVTKMWRTLSKIETRQRFNPIGLKFYYIEDNVSQNWTTAAQTCRQMGGQLASIQNKDEFQAIKEKINPDFVYWLDINDRAKKGEFISVASGERVKFFKWLPGEPLYDDESQRYVNLFNGGMRVENGSKNRNFICQYDDKD